MEWTIVQSKKARKGKKLLDESKFYEDLILGSYKPNIAYTTDGKIYDKGKIICLSSAFFCPQHYV
jgi:hypothetical protein